MTGGIALLTAHLIGETWHIADLLLYGGASVGLMLGCGLFLWGRAERRREPVPPHQRKKTARRKTAS
jgi:hypothetical protein